MMNFIKKNKLLQFMAIVLVIYILQFIIFPNFLSKTFSWYDNYIGTANLLFFIGPIVLLSVLGNILFDIKMKIWAILDFLYGIMICIYHGKGLYGIGLFGVNLDGAYPNYSLDFAFICILIIVVMLFIIQLITYLFCSQYRNIRKNRI